MIVKDSKFFGNLFLRFLLCGCIAASINFFSRIYYANYFNFSYSVILAYITGMCASFILSKIFVFSKSNKNIINSGAIFLIVNLIALSLNWLVSIISYHYLSKFFGPHKSIEEISSLIGILFPVIFSYIGHRKFSFSY